MDKAGIPAVEYQFNKAALELLFMPWEFPESHRQRADKDGRALASRRAGTPNGEDKLREPHQGPGWLCRCRERQSPDWRFEGSRSGDLPLRGRRSQAQTGQPKSQCPVGKARETS